jgi:hypothetical protein
MPITFSTAKTRLAQVMGDANASGVALHAQWSETEYEVAINFAINLIRERHLLPATAELTWTSGTYEYDVPGGLVYLTEALAESNTPFMGYSSPSVGTGVFQYLVSNEIISSRRKTDGTPAIVFDKSEADRHGLNKASLKIRLYGYKYQAELSAGSDELELDWSQVILVAKQYLHLSGAGRDPSDLMKHLRQWQAVGNQIGGNASDDIEAPGGIWLVK